LFLREPLAAETFHPSDQDKSNELSAVESAAKLANAVVQNKMSAFGDRSDVRFTVEHAHLMTNRWSAERTAIGFKRDFDGNPRDDEGRNRWTSGRGCASCSPKLGETSPSR
jgi:hypothetical protein